MAVPLFKPSIFEESPHQGYNDGMTIRVLSFNIRCAAAQDGPQSWEARRGLVIERIRAFNPDLIGMQECEDNAQAEFVRQNLPDYAIFGVRRSADPGPGREMAPVLYRQSAFERLDQGVFWLSRTPEKPGSLDWGAVFPRTVTWVRLRPIAEHDAVLTFFNTHFDYATSLARLRSAQLLNRRMAQIAPTGLRLLSGDFNAGKDSSAYAALAAGGLMDPLHAAGVSGATFHDFGRLLNAPAGPNEIDWIFVSPLLTVSQAVIDRSQSGDVWPSDHFPVGVEVG